MFLLTIPNFCRIKQKYGRVCFRRAYSGISVLTVFVNTPGKDYSNPRVLDFHNLHKPEEDMYDRSKVPRMPWYAFTEIGIEETNALQARCWGASCRPTGSRSGLAFHREVRQKQINTFYLLLDNVRWNWLLRIKV